MQIKVLFDSLALNDGFLTGWGFSLLVNDTILFDTGEQGDRLIQNMQNLGLDPASLEAVVISHDHRDHQGGLWAILKENPKIKIYACPNFSKGFREKVNSYGGNLIPVGSFMQIAEDVYITGEIEGRYAFQYLPEQALILKGAAGLVIVTGCAHPGIIKIIERVKQDFSGSIYLVLGGFHLKDKTEQVIKAIIYDFKQLAVKKVAPTHCTGNNAVALFKKEYNQDFIEVKVGQILDI